MIAIIDCSSTNHDSSRCPHCGGYIYNTNNYAIAAVYVDTTHEIISPVFDYKFPEGLIPSYGYWPHHLHEKFVKERVKPTDQFKIKPIINRKQFMQLKTFKNLRF